MSRLSESLDLGLFDETPANVPLAEKYRPESLEDLVGQERILPLLKKLLEHPQSVILYGNPGCGKTTFARILAGSASMPFVSINAITAGTSRIRDLAKPCILFVDEIQYFNKKQQQTLLPFMESGEIILIGATTESPWHTLNQTILSRASVIHFDEIRPEAMEERLKKLLKKEQIGYDAVGLRLLAERAGGDMRLALTTAEMIQTTSGTIREETVEQYLPAAIRQGYADDQDDRYSWMSALQKSIRGSDPDAAVFYLARILESGGLKDVCRRLLVCAGEDIGMAYPQAQQIAWAAVQSAREVGMPEARFPLSTLVIFMAECPKSFSAGRAYFQARADIEAGKGKITPRHLSRDNAPGYVSPHTVPEEYIDQPYLPEDLHGRRYYVPGNNKTEQSYAKFLQDLKKKSRQ